MYRFSPCISVSLSGYIEAVVIPAGARRIKVVEDKPSHSFLGNYVCFKVLDNDDCDLLLIFFFQPISMLSITPKYALIICMSYFNPLKVCLFTECRCVSFNENKYPKSNVLLLKLLQGTLTGC